MEHVLRDFGALGHTQFLLQPPAVSLEWVVCCLLSALCAPQALRSLQYPWCSPPKDSGTHGSCVETVSP